MSDTNQTPQPIIDLILADINAVIPNLSSLVASYRLLVGASEEIHRTPEICPDVFERAVRRFDNAGTLIDIFIELLYCKIAFSSEFLKISCAPVDLFRLLNNRTTATDVPFHTAEQVVEMEVLRRVLEKCHNKNSCMPEHPVVCPEPPIPPPNQVEKITDLQNSCLPEQPMIVCYKAPPVSCQNQENQAFDLDEEAVVIASLKSQFKQPRESPIESRVRRRHLKDAYDTPKPNRK